MAKKTIRGKVRSIKKVATTHTDALAKKMSNTIKYHERVDTFLKMFNPTLKELPIDELEALPENEEINGPLVFDLHHERLTKSIKAFGPAKPLITFRNKDGRLKIIDGLRIKCAAEAAGFTHISCLILEVDEARAVEIMHLLNTGHRKETYATKAKRLELLNKYAKQFIKENGIGDNEDSSGETRDYIAAVLKMCPTNVSKFQAVCAHPEKDTLIANMDDKSLKFTLNKAAAIARNKTAKVTDLKKTIAQEKKQEFACADCPRRNKFKQAVDNYGDMAGEVATQIAGGSEGCND